MGKKYSNRKRDEYDYDEYDDYEVRESHRQKEKNRQRRMHKQMKTALKTKDLDRYSQIFEDY